MAQANVQPQAQGPASYRAQLAARRRQQLVAGVAALELLPTTVAVPMRVLTLQRSGTAGVSEFAETIAADTGLATKILRLANSAAFARRRRVCKLTDAIAAIGLKNILSLVFGVSVAGIFHRLSAPSDLKDGFWKAALLKAVVAREYARRHAPEVAEEAFLCGMMQDLSLPLLFAADASARGEILASLELDTRPRRERELSMHGIDHGTLGRLVCAKLELPALYQLATGAHHDGLAAMKRALRSAATTASLPKAHDQTVAGSGGTTPSPAADAPTTAALERLAEALDLAAALPHRAATAPKVAAARLAPHFADPFGAAPDACVPGVPCQDLRPLLTGAADRYAELLTMLGDHADETGVAFKQFLQTLGTEITKCLEAAATESATVITTLETHKADLENEVGALKQQAIRSDFDPLTKVLNRRGFVARARRLLRLAFEHQAPVAMGFVDLDDFKGVNDALGHAAGDAALAAVAARLTGATRGRGIVGRLGGDEFAVALVLAPGARVADEGEKLSLALADLRVGTGDVRRRLTTSIGLAWVGVPAPDFDVESALADADGLMYGAKRTGKARCVVGDVRGPNDPPPETRSASTTMAV